MSIFEFLSFLSTDFLYYAGIFILVLSILVFVHEWGHYIIARLCGVRVESFSIGFGPELFGINDKNGTRWKVSAFPLGGYVKLFGDTDPASAGHTDKVDGKDGETRPMTNDERKVAFFAKPVWKRAAIVFAGPAINYIFAIILLAGLYVYSGKPVTPPYGAAVIGGSAAEEAGFLPHDKILKIDGKTILDFDDIRREIAIALDQEKHFVVERNGEQIDIYAAPKRLDLEDRFGFKHSRGMLGLISPRQALHVKTMTSIDGQDVSELSNEEKSEALQTKMGQIFEIEVAINEDKTDRYIIQPLATNNQDITDPDASNYNVLVLSEVSERAFVQLGFVKALTAATYESYVITRSTLEALGQMFMGVRSATELGGVIRIGAVAGDMASQGIVALILFTALLSINLGLINLFPIPLLDGGHLVFYAFEAVRGKPVPDAVQEYAFQFGLFFLIGVMLFANLNDLAQIFL